MQFRLHLFYIVPDKCLCVERESHAVTDDDVITAWVCKLPHGSLDEYNCVLTQLPVRMAHTNINGKNNHNHLTESSTDGDFHVEVDERGQLQMVAEPDADELENSVSLENLTENNEPLNENAQQFPVTKSDHTDIGFRDKDRGPLPMGAEPENLPSNDECSDPNVQTFHVRMSDHFMDDVFRVQVDEHGQLQMVAEPENAKELENGVYLEMLTPNNESLYPNVNKFHRNYQQKIREREDPYWWKHLNAILIVCAIAFIVVIAIGLVQHFNRKQKKEEYEPMEAI